MIDTKEKSAGRKGAAPLTHDLLARKGEAVAAVRGADLDTLLSKVGPVGPDAETGEPNGAGARGVNPSPVPARKGLPRGVLVGGVALLLVGAVAAGYFLRPEGSLNTARDEGQAIPAASETVAVEIPAEKAAKAPAATIETVSTKPVLPTAAPVKVSALAPVETKTEAPKATDIAIASGSEKSPVIPAPPAVQAQDKPAARAVVEQSSLKTAAEAAVKTSAPVVNTATSVPPAVPAIKTIKKVEPKPSALAPATAVKQVLPVPVPPVSVPPTPQVPKALAEAPKTIEPPVVAKSVVPPSPRPRAVKPKITAPKAVAPVKTASNPAPPKNVQLAARQPAPPRKAATPPVAKSNYFVQFVSVKSHRAADREWSRLKKRYAALLGPFEPSIQKATVAKRGTFYRLRAAGFETSKQARDLCAKMKAAGQGCLVVKR